MGARVTHGMKSLKIATTASTSTKFGLYIGDMCINIKFILKI